MKDILFNTNKQPERFSDWTECDRGLIRAALHLSSPLFFVFTEKREEKCRTACGYIIKEQETKSKNKNRRWGIYFEVCNFSPNLHSKVSIVTKSHGLFPPTFFYAHNT